MKRLVFLFISGTIIFFDNGVLGRDADLIKLEVTGDCQGCNLIEAKLSGKVLVGADLSNANLSGSNLSGADLSGANLSNANLKLSNLKKIKITSETIFCNTEVPWGIDNSKC